MVTTRALARQALGALHLGAALASGLVFAVGATAQQVPTPQPAQAQPQPAKPQPVQAQPPSSPLEDRARALFLEGIELSRQEHWGEALAKFDQSWSLVPRPNTMFNIASVLVRLQRYARASDAFERYLKMSDPVKDRPTRLEAERQLAEAKTHLGTLALELFPGNADVRVNGAATPNTGAIRNLRLDEGTQLLHVSAPGYQTRELQVPITAGATDRLGLQLVSNLALTSAPTSSGGTSTQKGSGGVFSSPVFWAITGVVLTSAAISVALMASSGGEGDPYGGKTGIVLGALR